MIPAPSGARKIERHCTQCGGAYKIFDHIDDPGLCRACESGKPPRSNVLVESRPWLFTRIMIAIYYASGFLLILGSVVRFLASGGKGPDLLDVILGIIVALFMLGIGQTFRILIAIEGHLARRK